MAEAGPPDEAAALAAARRHFPDCRMVGAPLRLWRARPAAEAGMLELAHPAAGWAFIAWNGRAEPIGLVELHADGREVAHRGAAARPWLRHALHLALAQVSLPDLHAAYLIAFEAPGEDLGRAMVADFLHYEVVVPLQDGAAAMPGTEFAAWLHRHGPR